MNLKIKPSTPLKYHLNMHLMESFIERDSIAFEIVKYVMGDIETHEKEMILDNFKFTSKTLKYIFGERIQNEEFKTYVIQNITEMIATNWIDPKNKSMYITEKMISHFYNID